MNNMQLEPHSLYPHSQLQQPPPPYSAIDFHTVHQTDQLSLPAPVVIQPNQVLVNNTPTFHRYRQEVICLSCQQQIVTKTEYRIGGGTWFMCCVVFFGGGFGCCFIPFLLKSCKDVVHRCPECNTVLGRKPLI